MDGRRLLALPLALGALVVVGCGDDETKVSTSTVDAAASSNQPTETQAATTGSKPADPEKALKDTSKKPEIAKPSGSPPARLEQEDIVKGKGPAAKAGDSLTVQYVGVSFATGEQFDASWDNGQPFDFQLGQGMVIPGWDKGLEGMKVGGRRRLTIPPEQAYGRQGSPPAIGPNETLIFVIDLLNVQ